MTFKHACALHETYTSLYGVLSNTE